MEEKEFVSYLDKKVVVKSVPKEGENFSIFVRPGDEVDFNINDLNLDLLEYQLIGGDIVVMFPDGGMITFASMALMGYSNHPPVLNFGKISQSISVDDILSAIEEVNELPIESVNASFRVRVSNTEEETGVVDKTQETPQAPIVIIVQSNDGTKPYSEPQNEKFEFEGSAPPTDNISPVKPPESFFKGYYVRPPSEYTGFGDYDHPGVVSEAAKPAFYFKATAHQVKQTDPFYNDEGMLEVKGGGGSINGYNFESVTNQFEAETIDFSNSSEDMVIRAENNTFFSDTPQDSPQYLSRVLRFEPQMPEGFYVDSFTLGGLPEGITILDKTNSEVTGSSITKDDMIFKDSLGNVIDFWDANFLTEFKTAEFILKYEDDIADPFNISITANYKIDQDYVETIDIDPNQSFTNNYTIDLKDITAADDYTYEKSDYADGEEEGFIFSKDSNYNEIILGSGDNTVYGGNVKDVVYDGAGDDTIYTSDGVDTIYGGAGENLIYGDTYFDETDTAQNAGSERNLVSYAEVGSYSLTELKLLRDEGKLSSDEYAKLTGSYSQIDENGDEIPNTLDVDMLAYYKGVYVDLDGFTDEETLWVDENGNDIVDDDEKINALSKFAYIDGTFTYNDEGDAISTTLTDSGLSNLQPNGYDKFYDIDDVEGSNYNDTIYGSSATNVISGLEGSDILDGRGGGDTLLGNEGYDTLFSGSGDDVIDGGEDTDAVNYQNANNGVIVRLDKPNGDEYDDFSTGHGSDTLYNIEDVIGSDYGDTVFGSGGTNYVMGMDGDDSIFGGKGYDFIDGGDGSDWISYYIPDYPDRATNDSYMENIQGITVSMGNDFIMLKETSTGRLIDLIQSIEQVSGTYGVDSIWGDNSDEIFWGHEGNDNLRGWNGDDSLLGGDDDDYILPGRGVDYSDGGDGVDFLDLHREDTLKDKTIQWLRLDESGTVQYSNDSGGSWSDGYESNYGFESAINFEGMRGDNSSDHIIGNSIDNSLEGYSGHDDIYGGGGDDFIRGNNGDDSLYGEAGDDTIYGDRNDDYIEGGTGDDLIYGYGRYNNETNNDTIDGGDGSDTVNYISARDHLVLDMSSLDGSGYATAKFESASNGGDGRYNDLLKDIENITGGRGNDTITGDSNENIINAWHGNDTIYGGDGDDTLYGGAHTDSIEGGLGNDYINLDQYSNEDTRVHGRHNEIAYGGEGNDTIVSQGGSDYLYGEAGDDEFIVNYRPYELYGGDGTDTLTLGDTYLYLRNTDIQDIEVLNIGSGRTYFNHDQIFTSNDFETITGDENSQLFIYGSNGVDDNFDLSGVDISGFDGLLYAHGYNGTDTLTLSNNQSIKMADNYYNTLEDFDLETDAVLNVQAANDNGRRFYSHDKNFDDVDGQINHIGGSGNDTFYLDFSALQDGKFTVQGGAGNDMVDIRNFDADVDFTDASFSDTFSQIETLDIDRASAYEVNLSAEVLSQWIEGDELNLNIANNTQGQNINIDTHNGNMSNFTVGSSYNIQIDADDSFTLNVV